MVKKRLNLITALVLLLFVIAAGVGGTVALLIAVTKPVTNTFTIGDVNILLTETTGDKYDMIPGKTVSKDPKVTVKGGSEECWLFVRLVESEDLDLYIDYEVDAQFLPLSGFEGVYYLKAPRLNTDMSFSILKNDGFTVRDSITKEQMADISENPTVTFYAYAVQCEGVASVFDAWDILTEGR